MAILCLDVAVPTAQKLDLTEHTGSKRGLSCLGVSLEPNDAELVVARKVPVTDCRVVRGFLGTPVDGSVHSWDYRGQTREYPNTASDGVVYSYNNNDGLHITLADEPGFDLVVLRGGAQTKMYSDTKSLAEPADGQLLCEFEGTRQNTTVCFSKRVRAHKVSFFGTKSGTIADASFYRIEKKGFTGQRAELWAPGDGSVAIRKPDSQFAPESLYLAMKERYPAAQYHAGSEDDRPQRPIFVHHRGPGPAGSTPRHLLGGFPCSRTRQLLHRTRHPGPGAHQEQQTVADTALRQQC